jgi:hypothetical protein
MPKSNTAKAPQDRQSKGYGIPKSVPEDLLLPSGGLVLARRPGLQGLMKAGILENLDTLTAIVSTETIPKAEGRPTGAEAPKVTAEQITESLRVMDAIVTHCVIQPPLHAVPTQDDLIAYNEAHPAEPKIDVEALRDPDLTYVDEVEIEDKTFITQFAMGGTRDLERFRAQSPLAVGSVPAGA